MVGDGLLRPRVALADKIENLLMDGWRVDFLFSLDCFEVCCFLVAVPRVWKKSTASL